MKNKRTHIATVLKRGYVTKILLSWATSVLSHHLATLPQHEIPMQSYEEHKIQISPYL